MTRQLPEMEARAADLIAELSPYCSRLEVAGSVRRKVLAPSDIEIVVVPCFQTRPSDDLFGTPEDVDLLQEYVRGCLGTGKWKGRPDKNGRQAVGGERFYRLEVDGCALDLFAVLPPAQFGVIMAIRTGPADYSKRLVTHRRKGGLLPEWLKVQNGSLINDNGQTIPTLTEAGFFAALELAAPPPEDRR